MVRIGESNIAGQGLFAVGRIMDGALIDICPSVSVENVDALDAVDGISNHYWLHDDTAIVAFGDVQMCNHSDTPNARVDHIKTALGWRTRLYAIRKINDGEEITIAYKTRWW